jgi:deoxycytidine triphosphate deaminase
VILTGSEIEREWANGRITIEPFTPEQVNPNSYNFRLGPTLRVYRSMPLDAKRTNEFDEIQIPEEGYVLEPGRLYLAHTIEVLGSESYAPTFAARSSVARLGIFINLSASLGDIGFTGQWTLQLYSLNRVRVYPGINIGQMMWWRPQGEIKLYDGKYQGSVGPRSSDIHLDIDKQFARQRFPGLGASVEVAEVGPKFAQLALHSRDYRVPTAFCVPAGEFTDALTDEQHRALREAFDDLRATVGAFYADSARHISEIAAGIRLPEQARTLLAARLRDVFGDEGTELAVRSSGLDEDTAASSQAGIHDTVLGVTGAEAVIAAVEQCWASYYAPAAVAARVRGGDYRPEPRLAVIVQALIRPSAAGVAITGLDAGAEDRVTVEYVAGLAADLVAGVAVPERAASDRPLPDDAPHAPVLREVFDLARSLRERAGHEVDVEWAADADGVHLVQVRALTAVRRAAPADEDPHLTALSLYFDDLPAGFDLGAAAAVYGSYVVKRGPAYRLARQHGVSVGAGWVVRFNGLALRPETSSRLAGVLAAGAAEECVLDFGDTLRQIVVPKAEVAGCLAQICGADQDQTTLHTVVVRDFHRGQLGVISRPAGDGLVVELSADGLMALNRGTAGGETIVIRDVRRDLAEPGNVTATPGAEALLPHLAGMAAFSAAMRDVHGPLTLEWVLDGAHLLFVDYSRLGAADTVTVAGGGALITAGTAAGPLLRLDDEDDLLGRLSIGPAVSIDKASDVGGHEGMARVLKRVAACDRPPVVYARRPYAVLSVLIGQVAGFVFEQGSVLGHLAILLREAGLPAVAAGGALDGVPSGAEAVVSDGTITTTIQKEDRL